MPIDFGAKSNEELDNLIENYRKKGLLAAPVYLDALNERENRRGGDFKFEVSMGIIREAASKGKYISYKQLADASGISWDKAHYSLGGHLGRLVVYARGKGWPLISAIVVNARNVESGCMEPETLKGFIRIATELNRFPGGDEKAFLKAEQRRVFDWAAGRASA